jgi:hypothetical protein
MLIIFKQQALILTKWILFTSKYYTRFIMLKQFLEDLKSQAGVGAKTGLGLCITQF